MKTAGGVLEPFHEPQHAVALKTIVVAFGQHVDRGRGRRRRLHGLDVVHGLAQGARPDGPFLFQARVRQLLVPGEERSRRRECTCFFLSPYTD